MEQHDSRPRFKLLDVVMPRLWYVKLKQIRRSYRRKRPAARGAGEQQQEEEREREREQASFSSSYDQHHDYDTSFQSPSSCEPSFHLHSQHHFRTIDGATRSLIDVAFPLSPNLASSAHPSSPLRYAVSPLPPSSRFYPSPCRFGNHLPPILPAAALSSSAFPPKAIDISYPISPRKPPPPPPPLPAFLSHTNVDFLLSSATARRSRPTPPTTPPPLLRSRSVRSSLFACFSDDFNLPPASHLDPTDTYTPASSSLDSARQLSPSSSSATWRSSSARHSTGHRPSTHRRGLSLSCISNTGSGSPDTSAAPAGGSAATTAMPTLTAMPASASRRGEYEDASQLTREWERETSWTVLAEFDNEVVTRRVVLRKRVAPAPPLHQLRSTTEPQAGPAGEQGRRLPPTFSPSSAKFLEGAGRQKPPLPDACKGEATAEVDNFRLSTSSGDVNAEHNAVPWDKDFSSATSEDPESLFTSFEVDSACVTPRQLLSAFQASRAAHASSKLLPKFTRLPLLAGAPRPSSPAAAAAAAWGPAFIPEEECQVASACSSPDTHATTPADDQLSEASETPPDYDTDASIPSSYGGTAQTRCAIDDDDEDESVQSWNDQEMAPLQPRIRLAPLQEWQHPDSLLLSALRDPGLSAGFLECSSSHATCTDDEDDLEDVEEVEEEEQQPWGGLPWREAWQSQEYRHFPSSEDEIAGFNSHLPPAFNGTRLVVSDESPEREDLYSRARTEAREGVYLRRRGARCKKNEVASGKRVDRKSAIRASSSSATTTTTAKAKEAQATTSATLVNLPAEIRGKVRDSVPVVTRSYDPYRDFRDSMLEMILEKDILETQDLEELLHAYLALNEGEFHGLIVEVFTDLWYHMFEAETSRL